MKKLIHIYLSFWLTRRTYLLLTTVVLVFVLSFFIPVLFNAARLFLLLLSIMVTLDAWLLYIKPRGIEAERIVPDRFSNGDDNKIEITIRNHYTFPVSVKLIDELPVQFQYRDWKRFTVIKTNEEAAISYSLRPLKRGEYSFGVINAYITSPLRLVQRRYVFDQPQSIPTYPSFHQLKKYQLMGVSSRFNEAGNLRLRKLGNSMEFEQIKEYVSGDDHRKVNWKATARKTNLMVNMFTDEKSKHIYCLIDKGRNMKMPFEGMTLLDYAINAAVALSRTILSKKDNAGLVTFSNTPETFLAANHKSIQMQNMMEALYRQQTDYAESDFESLYTFCRKKIKTRSVLILFTNFESVSGFHRHLPYLRKLAKHHSLLVVFFENTEIKTLLDKPAGNLEEIYLKTIAEKFALEKRQIVKELQQWGILSLLTTPRQVSIQAINKYLELKTRQAL